MSINLANIVGDNPFWYEQVLGNFYKSSFSNAPSGFVNKAFQDSLDVQKKRSFGLLDLSKSGLKRQRPFIFDLPSKRPSLPSSRRRPIRSTRPMAFKKRRRFRRRFRKRFKRRSRFTKRGFKNRLIKTIALAAQQRKLQEGVSGFQLHPTDGSAPQILILAPYTYGLSQGVTNNDFTGNQIYLRGVRFRAALRVSNAVTSMVKVRCWLLKSRNNSAVTANGTVMNSTTDDFANPSAGGNQNNVRQFDSAAAAYSPFVGDNITTPFDTSEVKIMKMYTTTLQTFGVAATEPVKLVDWWFPINKRWTIEDTNEEGALTAPFFGKWNTYYLCLQCYTGIAAANDIDNNNKLYLDWNMTSYWKDL